MCFIHLKQISNTGLSSWSSGSVESVLNLYSNLAWHLITEIMCFAIIALSMSGLCAFHFHRRYIKRVTNNIPVYEFRTPSLRCSPVSSFGSAVLQYGSCSGAGRRGWTPAALRSVCAFLPSFGSHSLEDLWFDRQGREAWSVGRNKSNEWRPWSEFFFYPCAP